jgi:hypothetical protein
MLRPVTRYPARSAPWKRKPFMDYQSVRALLIARGFDEIGADAVLQWLHGGSDRTITLFRHGRATTIKLTEDGTYVSGEYHPGRNQA